MLKSKSIIAAAIAAAFALPLAAYAAGTDTPGGTKSPKSGMSSGDGGSAPTMKQLDTNNDGYVSKEEAKKSSTVSKRFNQLDKDNDGKLSATELNAAGATGAGGSPTDRGSTTNPAAGPGGKGSSSQGSATEGRTGN